MHSHRPSPDAPSGDLLATCIASGGARVDLGSLFSRLLHDLEQEDGVDVRYAFWLDSASSGIEGGAPARWSILGLPTEVLRYDESGRSEPTVAVLGADGERRGDVAGTILDVLESRLREGARRTPTSDDVVPDRVASLLGAWFGYFGYETKADLGFPTAYTAPTPDAVWMASERLVVVDHETEDLWILGDAAWTERVDRALRGRSTPIAEPDTAVVPRSPGRREYLRAVEEALQEIRDGNSYEVCLTAETRVDLDRPFDLASALETYRVQRSGNPAPHAAFLWCDDVAVLSTSPERFLSVDEAGWCQAKPIKGTVPRAQDPEADARAAAWLADDPKTRAENLMIVDLMRNDLSRVCDPASVQVPVLMGVESYATVHQLVSTVRGRVLPGRTVVDVLRATFPAGSMTGAPKPRTLEIIEKLEGRARGIYSGALGTISPVRSDLSVVIRTTVLTSRDGGLATRLSVSAGGAIVADSDPDEEYAEMLTKLAAPRYQPKG